MQTTFIFCNLVPMLHTRHSYSFNDQELLHGFNGREEKAFSCIYEKYYNELFFFASRLFGGNPQISPSDIVQDLFLKIWEGEKEFESLEFLKSYLYLSIRNRWKNFLEHTDSVKKHAAEQHSHPTDDYILASIIESETLAILHQQLNTLSPACAQVIRLSLGGLSNQEISEKLGISIHTIYSHKQKAIQLLRGRLSKGLLHLLFMHW